VLVNDAGSSWTRVTTGTASDLHAVTCTPGLHCVAVGDRGTVLTTTGGHSWQTNPSGTTAALRGVACWDADHCIAVGDSGVIVATSDAGSTWSPRQSAQSFPLLGAACPALRTCYVVG